MHTAPAINRNRQTEFRVNHIAVATLSLAGLLASSMASAGTIQLWASASSKPAAYSSYISGSMTNPAGSYNTDWHATVSDPDFPATFQIKATDYTTDNNDGTGGFAQRDLALYGVGSGRNLLIAAQTGSEHCWESGYEKKKKKKKTLMSCEYDYFKLQSIAISKNPPEEQVPEPGALSLLGLSAIAAAASRRRRIG